MDLLNYLSTSKYEIKNGILIFDNLNSKSIKQNRINVLEELGKGIIWKNVYAHYYRFLFVMRWLKNDTIIVDLGCGRGWLIDFIYRNKYRVSYIGIDVSLNSLQFAQKKTHKQPVLLLQANCTHPPLVTGFADYVTCLEVIEHNNKIEAERMIKTCKSLLKPGGLLFLSTPNKKDGKMVFPEDHIYEWSVDELTCFVNSIGLEVIQIYGCFGKKEEVVNSLSSEEGHVFEKLSHYYNWHTLSPFFSTLHPKESQGFILLCKNLETVGGDNGNSN